MTLRALSTFPLLTLLACTAATGRAPVPGSVLVAGHDLHTVRVNGVEIHYVDHGAGEPILFVHGGLVDYREWLPVIDRLPGGYRTIAYSRRYNYPNDNALSGDHYSAAVEAEDLAALIRKLSPGRVHLAGISYGALTALIVALRHPELVQTLTVVEPPLVRWLPDLPEGAREYDDFFQRLIEPARREFRAGRPEEALRVTLDYFVHPGAMAEAPPEVLASPRSNLREWQAITTSTDAFPSVTKEEVRRLDLPVLMISGGKTYRFLQLTDTELQRLLPNRERHIVADGTHDVCSEQPSTCAQFIRDFLQKHPAPGH